MTNTTTKEKRAQVSKINKLKIPSHSMVNLSRMGSRHADITYMNYKSHQGIKKINKTEYVMLCGEHRGEIREFNQNDGKVAENLRKVFYKLSSLIKANFDTVRNENNALFICLEYQDNMQDERRLMDDFEAFMRRLRAFLPEHKLDYIVVAEPQERGAWHMHLMLKSDQERLFIDNRDGGPRDMDKLWGRGINGKGNAHVQQLKSDDVGAYYVSYFTALEVDAKAPEEPNAEYATSVDENTGQTKKHKKGGRLRFYPKHFKFYRCSRGIIRPKAEQAYYEDVVKEFGEPTYTTTYELELPKKPSEPQECDPIPEQVNNDKNNGKKQYIIQRESFKIPQTLLPHQQGSKQNPRKSHKKLE
jgi:L-rhamnose mutarotase